MDNDNIKNVSEATTEVAKFGTKALDSADKLMGFISKIFKQPLEETSLIVGDKLKFIRWERQLRIVDRVNKKLGDRGIEDTKLVPPKFVLPIMENASLEDNDELQDLWINLLTNSLDPNMEFELRYAYVEIIKSLTPLDVKILNLFYTSLKNDPQIDWDRITEYSLKKEQLCKKLSISNNEYMISMYNLFRVQCMAPAIIKGGVSMGPEPLTIFKGADAITLTPLGKSFIEACII